MNPLVTLKYKFAFDIRENHESPFDDTRIFIISTFYL